MILWEMMAGEPPFAGLSPLQIGSAVVLKRARPTIPASWPPRLAKLLRACWERQPARRPDAADVLKQLMMMMREETETEV